MCRTTCTSSASLCDGPGLASSLETLHIVEQKRSGRGGPCRALSKSSQPLSKPHNLVNSGPTLEQYRPTPAPNLAGGVHIRRQTHIWPTLTESWGQLRLRSAKLGTDQIWATRDQTWANFCRLGGTEEDLPLLSRSLALSICIARRDGADLGAPKAQGPLWESDLCTGLRSATEGAVKRGVDRSQSASSRPLLDHPLRRVSVAVLLIRPPPRLGATDRSRLPHQVLPRKSPPLTVERPVAAER